MIKNHISQKNRYLILSIVSVLFLLFLSFFSYQGLSAQKKKWSVITHDKTNFPLQGKHRTVPCGECHINGVMAGTPTGCESCHWQRKKDDRYQLQLGFHCGDCHTPFDWKKIKPNSWNHEQTTGFRLPGGHRLLDCGQCHMGNSFSAQTASCYQCHRADYERAGNPNHVGSGFSTDCQICHLSMLTWLGASFSHSQFILKGVHKTLNCQDCHKNGQYSGLASQCVDCHLDDYNSTGEPDHRKLGFSTDCLSCHSSEAVTWLDATFDHSPYWTLKGTHKSLNCSDCHSSGINLSSDCYSCHKADYEAAKNPEHLSQGFSTDCTNCHSDNALSWHDTVFNHDPFWPLKGAHKTLECSICHDAGYNLPTDCYGCHKSDYDATSDPNHQASGFPTNCQFCHFENHLTWSQAVSYHRFPINSGVHANFSCSDCHLINEI